MAKIEVGRFTEQLRRLLNVKSNEGPQDVAPEMVAVFVMENDRPEWGLHKGERWCRRNSTINAGAGFASKFKIRNPANSGVMIVPVSLLVRPDTDMIMRVRLVQTTVDYSSVGGSAIAIDTRTYQGAQVSAQSPAIISNQATDAVDADSGYFSMFIEQLTEIMTPGTLVAPGYALEVQGVTVNTGFAVNMTWRERAMSQAERVP